MSPEQTRGEGHRLDGRSDVFALGIILYELMTGRRPFQGSTVQEIVHQIVAVEPAPPSSIALGIPAGLERICMRALSKRIVDRFASAAELASDLNAWLNDKFHISQIGIVALSLCLVGSFVLWIRSGYQKRQNEAEAARLVEGALAADPTQLEASIGRLSPFGRWTKPRLQAMFDSSPEGSNTKLHAALCLISNPQAPDARPLDFHHHSCCPFEDYWKNTNRNYHKSTGTSH